jgi:aconitate hydratase
MIQLAETGVWLVRGSEIIHDNGGAEARLRGLGLSADREAGRRGTIASRVLAAHDQGGGGDSLRLRFDSLTSHDITYVGIIQTARASGMEAFPLPYVLTNCHNSLCAVGGTINQDDHVFALSAAKKYGGIYVPPQLAVIHSYNREMMAGGGKMILGSDSHTRYGALGTMGVGEGGGELAKQLLGRTYDIARPGVILVYLTGEPAKGVGPQDAALAIIAAVFGNGYVKNKVMEFAGGGVSALPVDFRNGIDVMTTETACWSSIWQTDDKVKAYLAARGRADDYRELGPAEAAYYDGLVYVDLGKIEPCIALPFHPSNVFTIRELQRNGKDILAQMDEEGAKAPGRGPKLNLAAKYRGGGVWAEQALIAGCAGGIFDNIMAAADILRGNAIRNAAFSLSVYPESQPTYLELVRNGGAETLLNAGALVREAFCGPCFGAGDTPANGELSIRHVTRNFPSREGSRPGDGQAAAVALMDARSIAATAINGGKITAATDIDADYGKYRFFFDSQVYARVYQGEGKPLAGTELVFGPNIRDWPPIPSLGENLLIKIVCCISDPVTTTDELIPSGETSSYRSNPLALAEFTLSRKDPGYVKRAKEVQGIEERRRKGESPAEIEEALKKIRTLPGFGDIKAGDICVGSAVFARKIGDGSAREQAASCQRLLGAAANFALEYATRRYRSNLINWGMLPFLIKDAEAFTNGDYVFVPHIRRALAENAETIRAYVIGGKPGETGLALGELSPGERQILADGCLINHYAKKS